MRDEGRWRRESSSAGGRGIALLRALGFGVEIETTDDGTVARLHVALDRPADVRVDG